jgi:hypothetical protein
MDVMERQIDNCDSCIRPITPSQEEIDKIVQDLYYMESLHKSYPPQSGLERQTFKVTPTANTTNTGFQDIKSTYMVDMGGNDDPTRGLHREDAATYEDFFKRPVKIYQEEWGTGNVLSGEVAPFFAYFTDKRVANRISNFNLLKADLHIKVMVNGNGFFYGKAMAAYHPLFNYDFLSSHSVLVPQDLTQTSQLPKVFIDPNTSEGGEMILPFFWHQDYIDITSTTDTTADIGTLFFRSFNQLKHANTAGESVTVTVLAWCENIELAVPTSENAWQLSPQSGKEDEIDKANKDGIVSGPASSIAKLGKGLKSVPIIGPYAHAASMAAEGVAKGAKLLGYSKPPLSNMENVRPTPTSNLALGNVPDTVHKLALDEKQALTLDPRIASLPPDDPLDVRNIACRESYLTKFNWFRSDNAEDCLLQAYVTPMQFTISGTNAKHLPACAAAVLPFVYWRGTMKFRFQIVSSSYHRGRLRFVYDPNQLPFRFGEYNINYQQVIDIGETKDFTIEIGMGKPYGYLLHEVPAGTDLPFVTNPPTALDVLPRSNRRKNGVLGVYVVNELACANTVDGNNNVEINVFVSAGDDFMVAAPDDEYQNFTFKAQSGMEAKDGDNTTEMNAPEQSDSFMLNPTPVMDHLNEVYMGESIPTFRTLLKRYSIHRRIPQRAGTSVVCQRLFERSCAFPYLRGNVPGAIDVTGAAAPYNYCNTVLIHWIRNMFAGWRGGIRYKAYIDSADNADTTANLNSGARTIIERAPPRDSTAPLYNINRDILAVSDFTSAEVQSRVIKGAAYRFDITRGGTVQSSKVNPFVEAEIPFYSPERFCPDKRSDYTGITAYTDIPQMHIHSEGVFARTGTMDVYVATAEDFQVYFFTGMPRIFYDILPSTSGP